MGVTDVVFPGGSPGAKFGVSVAAAGGFMVVAGLVGSDGDLSAPNAVVYSIGPDGMATLLGSLDGFSVVGVDPTVACTPGAPFPFPFFLRGWGGAIERSCSPCPSKCARFVTLSHFDTRWHTLTRVDTPGAQTRWG